MEKQRDKTAKRLQRKLGRLDGSNPSGDMDIELDPETGEPILPTDTDENTGMAE